MTIPDSAHHLQALDHQLRLRETALTTAEHRVELLQTRLENDASTTQKAAQAVEAERIDLKVPDYTCRLWCVATMCGICRHDCWQGLSPWLIGSCKQVHTEWMPVC